MDNSLYGKIKQTEATQEAQLPRVDTLEKENSELKAENLTLQIALAESEEARSQSELDIQLAIAELAEEGV